MKIKKVILCMIFTLASIMLVSCSINETVKDVTQEIEQQISKDDTDNLGITYITEQKEEKNGKDSLYSWSRSDHNSNPALSDHVTAGRKRDTGIL